MTTFPGSPKLLKGAIVGVSVLDPASERRRLPVQPGHADADDPRQRCRASGGPERGAAAQGPAGRDDQARDRDRRRRPARAGRPDGRRSSASTPRSRGLEMLLYPSSALVIANEVLARLGVIEVVAAGGAADAARLGPPKRVLPGAPDRASRSPRRPSTRTSTRSGRRSALDLAVLSYHDLGARQRGRRAVPRAPDREGGHGERGSGRPRARSGAATLGIGG